jgi:metacaspase-1
MVAKFYAISACRDDQESDDFVGSPFSLPNPAGLSGGACTTALLRLLKGNLKMTFTELMDQLRHDLKKGGHDQVPQLSSTYPIVDEPLLPAVVKGEKRALLIGINYVGQTGELLGCHTDIRNVKKFLVENGFFEGRIRVLLDDGIHNKPTKRNIENEFFKLCQLSKNGDFVWVHYAGHGRSSRDLNNDELDHYDETIVPVDYRAAGEISDDDINKKLVVPMPDGVTSVVVADSCNSGTILDLPYNLN